MLTKSKLVLREQLAIFKNFLASRCNTWWQPVGSAASILALIHFRIITTESLRLCS